MRLSPLFNKVVWFFNLIEMNQIVVAVLEESVEGDTTLELHECEVGLTVK